MINAERGKKVARKKAQVAPVDFADTLKARFSDEIDFLTADWGNRFWKQQHTGNRDQFTVMENTIAVLNTASWEKHKTRFKVNPARYPNTQVFGFRSRKDKTKMIYVAAGDSAKNHGAIKHMEDDIKYDYEQYWGAVVCSQLLTAFPHGHDYIVLALAHPTKSIGQRDVMVASTLGKHYVETPDGRTVRFVVREVLPWDEPVGGIIRWTETEEAKYNPAELDEGDEICVMDIGGGVTSYTRVQVGFDLQGRMVLYPIYDLELSPSIPQGSRTVLDKFYNLLTGEHEKFRGMKDNLTTRMLEQGLKTGEITLSAQPVDVTDYRNQAEYAFLDQLESVYINTLAGGRPFKLIVQTGGGMHIYSDRLKDEFLNHPNVQLASPITTIHRANLHGGDEIFRQWIERERFLS